ncbi:PLP-dependent aminotransferase family protein [Anaerocolumna sp. AGMB13025]|uniref:aminotransferase-like domain-containing protein n=1 Tax=Anaerocolumna sp. AGMB13025 TaxID=3039116 RepID=UPI0024204A0E|nr:PLP-dependent aminotransferase family protein [Anaerocolumna sp. AGMB13025]WFR56962.1 PLP-dependent aminotransferase family protein [Anaerocolumna sp. AGMB13025]
MRFSNRMNKVQKSFVREILKVTENKEVISFAGGLPNPRFFPVNEIAEASNMVLHECGESVLQYSTTEGYRPLREFIANRYYKDLGITADNIIITNGSQQALDLIGKILIDAGDHIIIEKPGYLGAIQAFSIFEPAFNAVSLGKDGIYIEELKQVIEKNNPKLFYAVTNFQNPTGITYSSENRKKLAEIMKETETILIDDNPYGELRFDNEPIESMVSILGTKMISLGSFSKVFAPAMRLGWICANDEIIDKLVITKQASDLHTNNFSQRVLYQYLLSNSLDEHIAHICKAYKEQKDCMLAWLDQELPEGVEVTRPKGGMFLWVTLPERTSSIKLFNIATSKNVAFVPGVPFYTNCKDINTLRMNFTNSSFEDIEKGVKLFACSLKEIL